MAEPPDRPVINPLLEKQQAEEDKPALPVDEFPREMEFYERIDSIVNASRELAKAGVLSPLLPEVGRLIGIGVVQNAYATYPWEYYEQGANPPLLNAIKNQEPVPLPPIATPTTTGLFIVEDSSNVYTPIAVITPRGVKIEWEVYHGFAAATVADATYQELSQNAPDKPPILVNRNLHEDRVGQAKITADSVTHNNAKASYVPDFAGPLLRYGYHQNQVNVFSVSQVASNVELQSAEERRHDTQQLQHYYGGNAVFIVARGNDAPNKLPRFRHSVVQNANHTLAVGALHAEEAEVNGTSFPVRRIAAYSTYGADVAVALPDIKTGYTVMSKPVIRKFGPFDTDTPLSVTEDIPLMGTSFAAPHAAAGVAKLMERYVRSPENPDAVLTPEHVLLAIKQTARPVAVEEIVPPVPPILDTLNAAKERTESTLPMARLAQLTKINGHYVSPAIGNGQADFHAASGLLETWEQRVRATEQETLKEGEAAAYVRERVEAAPIVVEPKTHTLTPSAREPGVAQAMPPQTMPPVPTKGMPTPTASDDPTKAPPGMQYVYTLQADQPLVAENIILDLQSVPLSKALLARDAKLALVNPQGECVELFPSACPSIEKGKEPPRGSPFLPEDILVHSGYVLARASSMQGTPTAGEWKLLSSHPIDRIALNFPDAMKPDDVGAVVKPDYSGQEQALFRNADLRGVAREELDRRFFSGATPNAAPLDYDFIQTAFPESYLELRLLAVTQKAHAATGKDKEPFLAIGKQLLETAYLGFDREGVRAAVEAADPKALLDSIAPDDQAKFALLKTTVLHDRASILQPLLDTGINPALTDAQGRTVLFYAKNPDVIALLNAADPTLKDKQDNAGQTAAAYKQAEYEKRYPQKSKAPSLIKEKAKPIEVTVPPDAREGKVDPISGAPGGSGRTAPDVPGDGFILPPPTPQLPKVPTGNIGVSTL